MCTTLWGGYWPWEGYVGTFALVSGVLHHTPSIPFNGGKRGGAACLCRSLLFMLLSTPPSPSHPPRSELKTEPKATKEKTCDFGEVFFLGCFVSVVAGFQFNVSTDILSGLVEEYHTWSKRMSFEVKRFEFSEQGFPPSWRSSDQSIDFC